MFNRIKGFFKKATVAASGVVVSASTALAEPATGLTIDPPTLDYALLGTMTASILAGLAAIWLIRKAIKLMNRS